MLMVARTGNSSTMSTSTPSTMPATNYFSSNLKMNLPQNLLHPIDSWTKHDVQKWIEYCIDEYSLGDVHLNDFEMNGKALLLLTEDNFKKRSSRSGDILHKALQQHRGMLKALHCQTFPFQLWNSFGFPPSLAPPPPPPSSSTRRLNIPTPANLSMPMSSFHPATNGVLPHSSSAAAAAATCMHPAFNYMFNRSETMSKPSSNNQRTNSKNSFQPASTRHREMSASSASSTSSQGLDGGASARKSSKSALLHPASQSFALKRECLSPGLQSHSMRQPTPNTSPVTSTTISPSIKQECLDDEDVDIEEHDSAPTPPITSSSPSSSPQSSSSIVSKFNQMNNETLPFKSRSQLISRTKQQPNDVTNTDLHADANNGLSDTSRQIRYYNDRIDFRGDILLKPPAAKNCRILWEFLYILLEDSHYESIIHWEDREKMIFRIIQADKLAALWGLQKNRLSMTYEKLSRGMRYYYSNNIISKEQSKRLLYRFMRSPDEIRKSMKRNGGTTSMVYSTIQKKNSPTYSTASNIPQQDTDVKLNQDNDDSSSSSTPFAPQQPSSSQIHNQILQLFSIYPPSASASLLSKLNPTSDLLFAPNQASSSPPHPSVTLKSEALLATHPKSDRSNSSSPQSFENSRDRTTDSDKQQHSPSQAAASSASVSLSTTSTKRKQAVPISLTARLSQQQQQQQQQHHLDQPLNLAVHRDEDSSAAQKKAKVSSSLSTA